MKLNRQVFSKHIAVTLSDDVNAICKPLRDYFNIDCFFFQRDFCNVETGIQEAIAPLCSNATAAEFTACDYVDTEAVPMHLHRQSHYYLNESHYPKWVAAMKENCNLHSFITKSEKVNDNTWDRFVFATSSPDPKYQDFYLNNRELLDNFVLYFKDKAKKFIELATNRVVPSGSAAVVIDDEEIASEADKTSFLVATTPKQYYLLDSTGRSVAIPAGEMKCLLLLARGRSAKEIAQTLMISPRTLETNLLRSKNRLGCYTKKELLDIMSFSGY